MPCREQNHIQVRVIIVLNHVQFVILLPDEAGSLTYHCVVHCGAYYM